MFLLDTNVISELRKAGDGKANRNVIAWLSGVDAACPYISAVTIMELEIGILRVEQRDSIQGARLRTWFDTLVLPEFSERSLPVDTAVALRCARLHVPDPSAAAYFCSVAIDGECLPVTSAFSSRATAGASVPMRSANLGLGQSGFGTGLQDGVEHGHFFTFDAFIFSADRRVRQSQSLEFFMSSHFESPGG
jgi:predicted nucleic acid-binding protein